MIRPLFGPFRPDILPRALMGCAVISGHLVLLGSVNYYGVRSYATATGEQGHIELGNGSVMDLDTETRVTVVPGRFVTQIHLLTGRVYLRLIHDDSKSTIVYAGNIRLTDIATQFAVRVEEKNAPPSVIVEEGIVDADALQPAGSAGIGAPDRRAQTNIHVAANTAVRAGEMAWTEKIGPNVQWHKIQLPKAEIERRLSWRLGKLHFDMDPLVRVVAEVNRYNRIRITLDDSMDDSIKNRPIGGVYTINHLPEFIKALEKFGSLDARQVAPDEILLTPRHGARPQEKPSRTPPQ